LLRRPRDILSNVESFAENKEIHYIKLTFDLYNILKIIKTSVSCKTILLLTSDIVFKETFIKAVIKIEIVCFRTISSPVTEHAIVFSPYIISARQTQGAIGRREG
jgi:hypothetical protein